MTLIIGIKCSGGVVIGADSAATMVTATGIETIVQPTTKLDVIKDKVIIGLQGQSLWVSFIPTGSPKLTIVFRVWT